MLKMLLLLEYHFFYWSLVSNTVICMNYSKDMHTHFLTLHFQWSPHCTRYEVVNAFWFACPLT